MKREAFFKSFKEGYDTTDGGELGIIGDLHEIIVERKNKNKDFFVNLICLIASYLQELEGIKDENGDYILKEANARPIEEQLKLSQEKEFKDVVF